jgi:hypothetical protein
MITSHRKSIRAIASRTKAWRRGRVRRVGKAADIVVLQGDPSSNIKDIEKVEIVFKDGVGYDSAKLIESVRGQAGLH